MYAIFRVSVSKAFKDLNYKILLSNNNYLNEKSVKVYTLYNVDKLS